jgi:hypothetical protein
MISSCCLSVCPTLIFVRRLMRSPYWLTVCMSVSPPLIIFLIFYAVCVVSKESRQLILPRTFFKFKLNTAAKAQSVEWLLCGLDDWWVSKGITFRSALGPTYFEYSFHQGWEGGIIQDVKLTTHLHLVWKLRMCRAIPPPPYIWMVWSLIKHRGNFTFTKYINRIVIITSKKLVYIFLWNSDFLPGQRPGTF